MSEVSTARFEVTDAENEAEHAALGAEIVARAIDEAVRTRGSAKVALSGGSTPGPVYRRLAQMALPLDRIDWFWVDERAVDPASPRSNFRAAYADLGLDRAPKTRVHRMEAEAPDLAAAAARYEVLLRRTFGIASTVAFDVMTLGIGDDGHTASLFPGMGATAIDDRLVAAIAAQPDKGLEARLTLTAPVLREARTVLVLARGAAKQRPIASAWSDGPEEEVPARLLLRARGRVVWLVDRGAYPTG
ncbi:6-phosphogluconolactonase [Polyangium sp. 6x1]|uniref:6-phosphogluconolactonase n=1 Tax=Polyangium sp. 6x1 TaxID=3042689 RepID=UPI0024827934|nr:6-phosphogluconolactonase [Polyangium sp. 6x1]MDI1451278.1 6-phosphogluconolactonase [Polyangium sp. 6x1]